MTEIVRLARDKNFTRITAKDLKELMPDNNKRNCQIQRALKAHEMTRLKRGEYFCGGKRAPRVLSENELADLLAKIKDCAIAEGAKEVYLFGSYLSKEAKGDSDIDIGVRGLPPKKYLSTNVKLERLSSVRIDFCDFDTSKSFFTFLKQNNAVELI